MNGASIPAIVMASMSLYVGCYHLLNYLRQRKHREDLTFGLLCLAMTLYAAFCAGLYNTNSAIEGAGWQRAQFLALAVFAVAFLWFTLDYTHQKPTIVTYLFSVFYLIAFIVQAADRSSLTFLLDHPSIKIFTLPLNITVQYPEVEFGLLTTAQSLMGVVTCFYILWLVIRYFRRGHTREAWPLLLALGFVFLAAMNDTAVSNGLYSFIYLIEYGYMALILLMAFSLSSTVVQAAKTKVALHESEERFRALVETTSDWVWEVNENGVYTYSSPKCRDLLGYGPEELVGKTPFDLMPAQEADRLRLEVQNKIASHTPFERLENTAIHKDGRLVVLETSGVPVVDENGKFSGFRGIDRDITDRKSAEEEKGRLQEQLQQAMKMEAIGRLAGGIAHDFNNLLTAIIGNIDLARMSLDSPDALARYLDGISMASQSAASLTRQLLAFSRRQVIEPKILVLNELITNLQELGCVKIDPGQFEQVLVNLAVNARDAMPEGGKLIIETSNIDFDEEFFAHHTQLHPGRFVLLAVSDTGHGMSEEVKLHVFEPFFTTKPIGRGTGLGLATIFGIVKQAGGAIDFYSVEGRGTTFKIYLPRIENAPEKFTVESPEGELPTGNETVLLVEDDEGVRVPAVMALEHLGYKVLSAPTWTEVFAFAEKYEDRIDLLLTDVVMPGINGRELANRLLALHPEMKVLYTSGYTQNVIVEHGVLEENLNFIGKPYSVTAMARKIRAVLESGN
jgi:PAS domain S-box-containing protein